MPIKTIGYAFLSLVILTQSIFFSFFPKSVYAAESTTPQVVEDQTNAYLIISAVQITGGTGKTGEDFVELFNPTNKPFDLNRYRLVKRTAAGTTDTIIKSWSESVIVQAHHFFLWANSNFSTIPTVPDSVSTATLADNNGIALRYGANDTGEIWDSVAWGSTVNVFENVTTQNPSANESLTRNDLFAETSEYSIKTSNPRNSTIEELPPVIEVEENEDTPVDDPPTQEDGDSGEEENNDEEIIEDETEDQTVEEGEIETQQEDEPEVNIKITEILPNPIGTDSGYEKIELYNAGETTVNLEGFKIDDVQSSQAISSNALTMEVFSIEPKAYKALTIPAGSFSLNNTGGDFVTIFNKSGEAVATAFYEGTSPEGKSYSLFSNNEWLWANSTFGKSNGNAHVVEEEDEEEDINNNEVEENDYDNSGLEITEIYPQPVKGSEEFVEIYNAGNYTAQLSQVEIYVGDRKKVLPDYELVAGKYFVITQSGLPVQLRNSGQTVMLKHNQTVLSTVTYTAAIAEASFAKFEDGFLWTTEVTNKKDNVLKIPEVLKKEVVSKAVTTPKTTPKKVAARSAKKTTAAPKAKPIDATNNPETSSKPQEQAKLSDSPQSVTAAPQKANLGKIIAMGAAAVTAGLIALYKLVFTAGAE